MPLREPAADQPDQPERGGRGERGAGEGQQHPADRTEQHPGGHGEHGARHRGDRDGALQQDEQQRRPEPGGLDGAAQVGQAGVAQQEQPDAERDNTARPPSTQRPQLTGPSPLVHGTGPAPPRSVDGRAGVVSQGGRRCGSSARRARPRWLAASFSAGLQLRGGARLAVRHEDRVVAEAAGAARGPHDPARATRRAPRSRCRPGSTSAAAQTKAAPRRSSGTSPSWASSSSRLRGVVAVPPGPAGGQHAGHAVERVHGQPRVVGHRGQAGGGDRVAGLGQRVLGERRAGLRGLRELAGRRPARPPATRRRRPACAAARPACPALREASSSLHAAPGVGLGPAPRPAAATASGCRPARSRAWRRGSARLNVAPSPVPCTSISRRRRCRPRSCRPRPGSPPRRAGRAAPARRPRRR